MNVMGQSVGSPCRQSRAPNVHRLDHFSRSYRRLAGARSVRMLIGRIAESGPKFTGRALLLAETAAPAGTSGDCTIALTRRYASGATTSTLIRSGSSKNTDHSDGCPISSGVRSS